MLTAIKGELCPNCNQEMTYCHPEEKWFCVCNDETKLLVAVGQGRDSNDVEKCVWPAVMLLNACGWLGRAVLNLPRVWRWAVVRTARWLTRQGRK